ncbi:hypothetical protein NQD34_012281 [Periophthalmus magnuspinnatus]|nr:hypothetical protein NQD34_012281 [Periophthalmus magnuspinnatus]
MELHFSLIVGKMDWWGQSCVLVLVFPQVMQKRGSHCLCERSCMLALLLLFLCVFLVLLSVFFFLSFFLFLSCLSFFPSLSFLFFLLSFFLSFFLRDHVQMH